MRGRPVVCESARSYATGWPVSTSPSETASQPRTAALESEPIVRYYWHLTIEAAVPFMSVATGLLNAAAVPFSLKVLADPDAYRRADAGVLYLRRDIARRLGDMIARIDESVAPALRRDVPLFTGPLAPGWPSPSIPTGPSSFGEHRCKVVATSFWRSFLRGESGRDARGGGTRGDVPGGGTRSDASPPGARIPDSEYILVPSTNGAPGLARPIDRRARPATSRDHARAGPSSPKEAAARIGGSLCQRAIWDDSGRLCNWMGRPSSASTTARPGRRPPRSAPTFMPAPPASHFSWRSSTR